MEFGSYDDYIEYKRKKNLLKKFKSTGKKIGVLMKAVARFDSSGKLHAERRDEGEGDTKKGAAPEATSQSVKAPAAASVKQTEPPPRRKSSKRRNGTPRCSTRSPPSPSES